MTFRSKEREFPAMTIALGAMVFTVVALACGAGITVPQDVRQVDTLIVYRDTTLMMCDCQPNRPTTGGLNLHED